ncbi:MAG: hypothetical protein MUE48_07685 [Desulfobacterales bacterium]|jgi:hypothetical protein|nr:hypothetical protein [Desulfobacterales bacterium]
MPAPASRLSHPWLWGLLAGFAALSVFGLLHHEPWRDEAQAWLIARDCPDLACVLRTAGYEGHPVLWHLVLRPLARVGLPFSSAKLVHLLIVLAAVFLFLRNAPLPRHQKVLFICGYFVAYEYTLLVRNYAMGFLVLFAVASIHPERFRRPLAYAALLALMANTALYGLVIALVLAAVYLLELRAAVPGPRRGRLAAAAALAAAGFALCLWQLWPPADVLPPAAHTGQIKTSLFNLSLSQGHFSVVSKSLVGAFLPVPLWEVQYWNTRLAYAPLQDGGFLEGASPWLRWAWGTLIVCPALVSVAMIARRTVPVLGYLASSLALLSVFFLVYEGGARHHGFIFMVFVFWWWVGGGYGENRWSRTPWARRWLGDKACGRLMTGFLLVQAAAAAAAYTHDVRYEFSSGRSAAAFLETEGLLNERTLIAAYPSKIAGPVLAHVGQDHPTVYMVEYRRRGSYMIWNSEYMWSQVLPEATVAERVDRAAAGGDYDRVILISNTVTAGRVHDERYRLIASFNTTVERQESLCIYERSPLR